jgi:hypothetical protein
MCTATGNAQRREHPGHPAPRNSLMLRCLHPTPAPRNSLMLRCLHPTPPRPHIGLGPGPPDCICFCKMSCTFWCAPQYLCTQRSTQVVSPTERSDSLYSATHFLKHWSTILRGERARACRGTAQHVSGGARRRARENSRARRAGAHLLNMSAIASNCAQNERARTTPMGQRAGVVVRSRGPRVRRGRASSSRLAGTCTSQGARMGTSGGARDA